MLYLKHFCTRLDVKTGHLTNSRVYSVEGWVILLFQNKLNKELGVVSFFFLEICLYVSIFTNACEISFCKHVSYCKSSGRYPAQRKVDISIACDGLVDDGVV